MDMQNMALVLLLIITITTGVIYGIYMSFERKKRWPRHHQEYVLMPVKSGMMGNRHTSLRGKSNIFPESASTRDVDAADFSDKW